MDAVQLWGNVMKKAVELPLVHVDRTEFLSKELAPYYDAATIQAAIQGNLLAYVDRRVIDKIARGCISYQTTVVSSVSALAGIPGGWAMAASIPADIAQFYCHVFILIQKLMYIYGWPSLSGDARQLSDEALQKITLFVGMMMGCQAAEAALNRGLKALAQHVITEAGTQALGRTALYEVARKAAEYIGIKLSKDSFAKGISKVIPLIGAPISAGVTYFTYRPMAMKLKRFMDEQYAIQLSLMEEERPHDIVIQP